MLCNKDKNLKKWRKKTDLKGTEIKFQCLLTRYSLVLRHFACQDFSRFLNSVNLYHTIIMYNCNKKGIIVIMSGFNFIKKVKLHQHARLSCAINIFWLLGGGFGGEATLDKHFGFLL